ncbi:TIGR03986 family type III CRISPR-associated RAMP protein [Streptosporangium sp. NPDC002607]
MSDDMKFLNPYTFVPAFPRDGLPEPLGDGSPLGGDPGKPGHGAGRDRLHPERWTGRIGVRLTVETPLLLLDTARGTAPSEGADTHRVYPVQVRGGRPHLAATSLKGMLRSAYETITNSRFGVFDGHDIRLGFRRGADYALGMVPVLVGANKVVYGFQQAVLKMYDQESGESIYPCDGQEAPQHLEQLRAVIRNERGTTSVVRFVRTRGDEELTVADGDRVVKGIAFVTGPNIEGKTSERLFYLEEGQEQWKIPLARPWSEIEEQWNDLITDYGKAHKFAELYDRERSDGSMAEPGERIGDGPGQLAWSPHLYDESRKDFKGVRLCYARLVCDDRVKRRCDGRLECDGGDKDCASRLKKEGRVDRLYPVLIPRDLYLVPPSELLDESLLPAAHIGELSPADRVFGWVAPRGKGARPSAYRGRLRIGPVICEQDADEAVERFGGDGLPLAILGQPKPQQGRFYLAESRESPDRPIKDGTPKEKLYQPGQGLRGRKVYWHHAGLDRRQHWSEGQGKLDPTQVRINGYYREYRRSRTPYDDKGSPTPDGRRYRTKDTEQRDTQNRSIKGWVRPGTTFRFVVEVRDLDDHELGALAWLLTLPPGHFHRLGLGRPLGFGSVRLEVEAENTELHSGAEYAAHYRSLSGTLPDTDGVKRLIRAGETFTRMVEGVESLTKVRDAMLAVSRGNPGLPVHYPRTQPDWSRGEVPVPPDPRGRNYEWFTENERPEGKRIAPGRGRSLPTPEEDAKPLTVYPVKKEDDATKKGNRPGRGSYPSNKGGKGQGNGGRRR